VTLGFDLLDLPSLPLLAKPLPATQRRNTKREYNGCTVYQLTRGYWGGANYNERIKHGLLYLLSGEQRLHCKKELAIFPSPAGMSLTKLSLAGKKLNYSRPGRA
jgi:hypothetical protein